MTALKKADELKTRQEVNFEDTWNVEEMFSSLDDFESSWNSLTQNKELNIEALTKLKGTLDQSVDAIKEVLERSTKIERTLDKMYTYVHLRHDEDTRNDQAKACFAKVASFYYDVMSQLSWIEPEILQLSQSLLEEYMNSPVLEQYSIYLKNLIRMKKHTLSSDQEELLTSLSKCLQSPGRLFAAMNNADFDFGQIEDANGESHQLSHGSYLRYLKGQDRQLRENAFKSLHGKFLEYENTLCEALYGHVQGHVAVAKARNYNDCLEASLYPKNISKDVYHNLIEAVRSRLPSLHNYIGLRKRVLNVDELYNWDVYVPLLGDFDLDIPYDNAVESIVNAMEPLGKEYQQLLQKGLTEDRWVDKYENSFKRSGAYSSGCYDSHPYILMNYQNKLNDVFTLAHEAGHSMHSLYSRTNQPFQYSQYTIFVAEVASTFNEELLLQSLLAQTSDPMQKAYLINNAIESLRGTLFRQTMFAEFELMIHNFVESNTPLTPALLKNEFLKLNQDYFGEHLCLNDMVNIEWARIPHFYSNFYVYQYATGISAALCLADKVRHGDETQRVDYLNFLKSGSSKFSLDILKNAGVDMRTKEPVLHALDRFDSLVKQLDELL
jgi:oligoendopeptidase F